MQAMLNQLQRRDEAMMPYGKTLGFTVESIAAGEAVVRLSCSTRLHNVFGYTHGGAIFSIADTAVGLANLASIGQDQTATTIECSISYKRPALSGMLRATARTVKQERTLSFIYIDGASLLVTNNIVRSNFDCGVVVFNGGGPIIRGKAIRKNSRTPSPGTTVRQLVAGNSRSQPKIGSLSWEEISD